MLRKSFSRILRVLEIMFLIVRNSPVVIVCSIIRFNEIVISSMMDDTGGSSGVNESSDWLLVAFALDVRVKYLMHNVNCGLRSDKATLKIAFGLDGCKNIGQHVGAVISGDNTGMLMHNVGNGLVQLEQYLCVEARADV
ncbi:hypothetical protein OGAPHI_003454 [Ogataea philodendri]|uniref:Uncharacterized protein n=1 Tax=Ogataea philodendri TaxID=1378263 RepID=A0A9P8P608_9ASCO|nr:uncharacterized protein OGAPHI_003454 [Ogataea philodendri]KAH3666458.1 hypothetical protein OGAPHI_003454 [Ogataea philodendri]